MQSTSFTHFNECQLKKCIVGAQVAIGNHQSREKAKGKGPPPPLCSSAASEYAIYSTSPGFLFQSLPAAIAALVWERKPYDGRSGSPGNQHQHTGARESAREIHRRGPGPLLVSSACQPLPSCFKGSGGSHQAKSSGEGQGKSPPALCSSLLLDADGLRCKPFHQRNLAIGIGIQNFPEGLAVSLPLRGAGFSTWRAFWYGQLSGMVEPVAGIFGAFAIGLAEPLLPYALAFAAGAMVYVVIDDIIPEAQTSGNGKLASWTSILGFVVMMSLDVGLG
ncbi:zinc transporter ZIP11 isoform X3 [Ambystoma mexicanum]|uniref:zinc transporter ZIP11 isoform X3 n=1 Tax=Ambystoma mexicanum TaxID=8296 RepID=UPI0037E990D9